MSHTKSFFAGAICGVSAYYIYQKYLSEQVKEFVVSEEQKTLDRTQFWQKILDQVEVLFEDHDGNKLSEKTMCLGNVAALIYHELRETYGNHAVNWCGFYLVEKPPQADLSASTVFVQPPEQSLTLGPFQGKPACVHIPFSKGVCGAAARQRITQLVPDVHEFPGHIACDSASESEIVVPIFANGEVIAVLDIDCPRKNGFSKLDKTYLEKIADIVGTRVKWE